MKVVKSGTMSKKHVTNFRGENFYTPDGKMQIKNEPVTPIEEFGDHLLECSLFDDGMRKSMSMNDIASLREDFKQEFYKHDPYYRHRQSNHPLEMSKTKFVSMAEAIYHYQRDTPGRFHSTKPQKFRSQGPVTRSELTRPQSPVLRCKARSRPLHVMSQKEKEEMELEELKKFKIKAQPIPKSVLEGTVHLPEVPKRAVTVPEPFNLTELHKKLPESPDQPTFKARPAPKHILEKPHIPPKPPIQVTKAVSPKFHYKRANSSDQIKAKPLPTQHKPVEKSQVRHGPVKPEPFSFQKFDEERKKRKEERIRRQIEEERKQASSFKAQPLPGAVKKQIYIATTKSCCSSTTSSENKENNFKFEAKPAAVLYKEPFKPVLQPTHILKQAPFSLTTEKRAAEREKFYKQLKDKEEEMEKLKQEKEREMQEAEKKAQAELRAKLVHHAKPVPIFNQFIPEKSIAPLTVPATPKFVRRLKEN